MRTRGAGRSRARLSRSLDQRLWGRLTGPEHLVIGLVGRLVGRASSAGDHRHRVGVEVDTATSRNGHPGAGAGLLRCSNRRHQVRRFLAAWNLRRSATSHRRSRSQRQPGDAPAHHRGGTAAAVGMRQQRRRPDRAGLQVRLPKRWELPRGVARRTYGDAPELIPGRLQAGTACWRIRFI